MPRWSWAEINPGWRFMTRCPGDHDDVLILLHRSSSAILWSFIDCRSNPQGSRKTAIGPDHLRVHPAACGAGQERDDVANVLRLPYPLERWKLAELLDLGLRLALQKQLGGHRPRRHRIDRDLAAAQFVGENVNEALHAGFRGDIRAVPGKRLGDHAAREHDDSAPLGHMLGGLGQDDEASSELRGAHPVEGLET